MSDELTRIFEKRRDGSDLERNGENGTALS
jgi:hypothetical protein